MKMNDLTGQRFGRLVVKKRYGSDKSKNVTWLCQCDCGNEKIVSAPYLKSGDTQSCGCLHKENVSNMMSTHKHSKTRLYRVWAGVKNRCYNSKTDNYQYYGGRGIKMCEEWKNDFESFRTWAYANGYDEDAKAQQCTLDRIDTDKDYCPDNCKWSDHVEQCNNQRSNKVFEYNGETHTMAEWARIKGINYSTLRARISHHIPFEQAINM